MNAVLNNNIFISLERVNESIFKYFGKEKYEMYKS